MPACIMKSVLVKSLGLVIASAFLMLGSGVPRQTSQSSNTPRQLPGGVGMVRAVAFSPDGNHIAAATYGLLSGRKELKLWDLKLGTEPRKLYQHPDEMVALRFNRDGTQLFVASVNGVVIVVDVSTGKPSAKLKAPQGGVNAIDLSPDSSLLAQASGHDIAGVQGDLEHGEVVLSSVAKIASGATAAAVEKTFRCDPGAAMTVAFSPDGTLVAAGLSTGTLKIWKVASGNEVFTIAAHQGAIQSVAFSPDGRRLASGSLDRTIKIWEVDTGRELFSLSAHDRLVFVVAFSPDGRFLASGSGFYRRKSGEKPPKDQGELVLWSGETGREIQSIAADLNVVQGLAFSPDGNALVWGGNQRLMLLPLSIDHSR